jgi:hypothetical protein
MNGQEILEERDGRLYRPEPTVFPCPHSGPGRCPCAILCFRMSGVATVYEPYEIPADGREVAP